MATRNSKETQLPVRITKNVPRSSDSITGRAPMTISAPSSARRQSVDPTDVAVATDRRTTTFVIVGVLMIAIIGIYAFTTGSGLFKAGQADSLVSKIKSSINEGFQNTNTPTNASTNTANTNQ